MNGLRGFLITEVQLQKIFASALPDGGGVGGGVGRGSGGGDVGGSVGGGVGGVHLTAYVK